MVVYKREDVREHEGKVFCLGLLLYQLKTAGRWISGALAEKIRIPGALYLFLLFQYLAELQLFKDGYLEPCCIILYQKAIDMKLPTKNIDLATVINHKQ